MSKDSIKFLTLFYLEHFFHLFKLFNFKRNVIETEQTLAMDMFNLFFQSKGFTGWAAITAHRLSIYSPRHTGASSIFQKHGSYHVPPSTSHLKKHQYLSINFRSILAMFDLSLKAISLKALS